MKLDSVGKHKIPSEIDVKSDLKKLEITLNQLEGVRNVKCIADFDYYVFTIKGDFDDVVALNKVYTNVYNFKRKEKLPYTEAYKLDANTFSRIESLSKNNIFDRYSFLSEDQFKDGKIMLVARFKKLVASKNNSKTIVSKNGQAILTKCNAAELMRTPEIINCKVNFK